MKLIESSVQIIEEKDPYKMIELAGRTCYKSENNITEHSAKEKVNEDVYRGVRGVRLLIQTNKFYIISKPYITTLTLDKLIILLYLR